MHYIYTAYNTVIFVGTVIFGAVAIAGLTVRRWFYLFRSGFEKVIAPFLEIIPKPIKPDHLSWSRVPLGVLVTVFLFLYPIPNIAESLYIIAWITDILDGALARYRKQFSDWGCRIDPLADKLMNDTIFIGYACSKNPELQELITVFWVIVIADAVTAVSAGLMSYFFTDKRIEANIFGKTKFFAQCAGGTLLMVGSLAFATPILQAAAILGILSAISYGYEAWRELGHKTN